jgi:hypothetical protein
LEALPLRGNGCPTRRNSSNFGAINWWSKCSSRSVGSGPLDGRKDVRVSQFRSWIGAEACWGTARKVRAATRVTGSRVGDGRTCRGTGAPNAGGEACAFERGQRWSGRRRFGGGWRGVRGGSAPGTGLRGTALDTAAQSSGQRVAPFGPWLSAKASRDLTATAARAA